MIIRLPGGAGAGIVHEPARLLDIYPTLLRLVGAVPPEGLEGRDLLGAEEPPAVMFAETRHKRTYRVSAQSWPWKYIRTYRAVKRWRLAPDRPEVRGLQAGMRVKVAGSFGADGILAAEKVSIRESGDDDLEISGPVSRHDPETGEFDVHVLRVAFGDSLRGPEARAVRDRIRDGVWVKVEGEAADGNRLLADKLEFLEPGDRTTQLEGIIRRVEPGASDAVSLKIGEVAVLLGADTRVKGSRVPAGPAAEPTLDSSEDPFAADRLLTAEGLAVEEALFNLEGDPAELRDLAASEAGKVEELQRELHVWLERIAMNHTHARPRRARLDSESVERLKALGYVE